MIKKLLASLLMLYCLSTQGGELPKDRATKNCREPCKQSCIISPLEVTVQNKKNKEVREVGIDKNSCTSCPGVYYSTILKDGEYITWSARASNNAIVSYEGPEIIKDGKITYDEISSEREDLKFVVVAKRDNEICASYYATFTIFRGRECEPCVKDKECPPCPTSEEKKEEERIKSIEDIINGKRKEEKDLPTKGLNVLYIGTGSGKQNINFTDKDGDSYDGSTSLGVLSFGYEHISNKTYTDIHYTSASGNDYKGFYTDFNTRISAFHFNTMRNFGKMFYFNIGYDNNTIQNGVGWNVDYEQNNNILLGEVGIGKGKFNEGGYFYIGGFGSLQNISEKIPYSDYWPYYLSTSENSKEWQGGIGMHFGSTREKMRWNANIYLGAAGAIDSELKNGRWLSGNCILEYDLGKEGGFVLRGEARLGMSDDKYEDNGKSQTDYSNIIMGLGYKF